MIQNELVKLFGENATGRVDSGKPVAIVDLGSNSVRLVAYEGLVRTPNQIHNEKMLCALGRNVAITGMLPSDGMEKALHALSRYELVCRQLGVEDVRVLATAAARDASNGPDFLARAEKVIGKPIELLSGAREARLSGLGVISSFYKPDGVVGDLGGGSLELVDVRGMETGEGISMPLGGLALQDLSGGSIKKAQKITAELLKRASKQLQMLKGRRFYAVGGTWRAVAKLHQVLNGHPLHVMHGYLMKPSDGLGFLKMLERTDVRTLKEIESVSEARHQLLAYGAVVLEEIIKIGKPKDIVISANGVREGLLFEALDEKTKELDPLMSAAAEYNFMRSRSPAHGYEMSSWTDRFVETLGLMETEYEHRLRQAGCLFADVSWRAHPDYRGEQGVNIVGHAATVGIDHPGRSYLALAVYFRFEGLASDKVSPRLRELAGPRLFERARLLAAIMRIAYTISAATGGVLPKTPMVVIGNTIVLQLPKALEQLIGDKLISRLRQLGKLLSLDHRIEII